jgi:hypothetical protein
MGAPSKVYKFPLKCKNNGAMQKDLKIQNINWAYLLKLNIDPFHFQKTYLAHSLTNLNDFCNIGCFMSRVTKNIGVPKAMKQF